MVSRATSKSLIVIPQSDDLFFCAPLACQISYRQCGLRHVKGKALRKANEGNSWVPEQWAKYASPCRNCQEGEKTAALLGSTAPARPGPNRPPSTVPMSRAKALVGPGTPFLFCAKCRRAFRGSHRLCPKCRVSGRRPAIIE